MSSLLLPWAAGLCGAVASFFWGAYPQFADAAAAAQFAGTVASVATTMLGFMLAALAVVASIVNSHLVRMMRKTGHYGDLLRTMFGGCVLFLWIAMVGLVMAFGVGAHAWLLAMLVGLHVAALWALLDVGRKFWLVLHNVQA